MSDMKEGRDYESLANAIIGDTKEYYEIDDEEVYKAELIKLYKEFDKKEKDAYPGGLAWTPKMKRVQKEKFNRIVELREKHLTKKGE